MAHQLLATLYVESPEFLYDDPGTMPTAEVQNNGTPDSVPMSSSITAVIVNHVDENAIDCIVVAPNIGIGLRHVFFT